MSRPGAWARVATNFRKWLKKDWAEKRYIGEDGQGLKYYELHGTKHNVKRGFDPPSENPTAAPGVEWLSWVKGTRRFPPNEQELLLNKAKQQAQLAGNTATEKMAPQVESKGPPAGGTGDGPKAYPQYKDLESVPGYRKGRDDQ
ncbi:unnamed protein product, partial [Mesorhabditis spiculigera]